MSDVGSMARASDDNLGEILSRFLPKGSRFMMDGICKAPSVWRGMGEADALADAIVPAMRIVISLSVMVCLCMVGYLSMLMSL